MRHDPLSAGMGAIIPHTPCLKGGLGVRPKTLALIALPHSQGAAAQTGKMYMGLPAANI